jgi:hypothetical protein
MGRREQERIDAADEAWNGLRTLDEVIEEVGSYAMYVRRLERTGWELACPAWYGFGFMVPGNPARGSLETHGGACSAGPAPDFAAVGAISALADGAASLGDLAGRFAGYADWLEARRLEGWTLARPIAGERIELARPR